MTEARHHRFGNTIFHLEPNLKDGPGGLRDCHVSQWMGMIIALASGRQAGSSWSPAKAIASMPSSRTQSSFSLQPAVTCTTAIIATTTPLPGTAQEELALRGYRAPVRAGFARRMDAPVLRPCQDGVSQQSAAAGPGFAELGLRCYRSFQHWRSRISNDEFSVVDGRVYFQQAADAREAAVVLRLFIFIARHGVALSAEAERRIKRRSSAARRDDAAGPVPVATSARDPHVCHTPHEALRAMHSLNLLTHAVPEFEAINLLVLRDLYHRYTVDEHTLLAIEVLASA